MTTTCEKVFSGNRSSARLGRGVGLSTNPHSFFLPGGRAVSQRGLSRMWMGKGKGRGQLRTKPVGISQIGFPMDENGGSQISLRSFVTRSRHGLCCSNHADLVALPTSRCRHSPLVGRPGRRCYGLDVSTFMIKPFPHLLPFFLWRLSSCHFQRLGLCLRRPYVFANANPPRASSLASQRLVAGSVLLLPLSGSVTTDWLKGVSRFQSFGPPGARFETAKQFPASKLKILLSCPVEKLSASAALAACG